MTVIINRADPWFAPLEYLTSPLFGFWLLFNKISGFLQEDAEESVLGNTSKTTIIVKFKGSIDVILSPVFLESIQRIFDALTPTFSTQHPVSVVNHLHSGSLDRVESKNTLKKEKSLDLQDKLVTKFPYFSFLSLKYLLL